MRRTLKNLKKVGILDDGNNLIDHSVVIMDPAYVHISGPTEIKLAEITAEMNDLDIYTTGRYGKWTYSSMEDCMVWAKDIVDMIKSKS